MNSIAPVWDGNETWLVLGGGGLLAAFPLAYAIILPALYAPMIAMLLGLVFRGVAFEFRWRDPAHRALWDLRVHRRFAGRDICARDHAGRAAARHHDRGPRLCRRLVGMAVAVQRADRARPDRRLCAARRVLAQLENRRRLAAASCHLCRAAGHRAAADDRHGQRRDADTGAAILHALAQLSRRVGDRTSAAGDADRHLPVLPQPVTAERTRSHSSGRWRCSACA